MTFPLEARIHLLTVIIASATTLSYLVMHRSKSPKTDSDIVGTQLLPFNGINWSSHDQTILLVLRDGCPFCEYNMAFYRTLSYLSSRGEVNISLIAVFPDDQAVVHKLLAKEHLTITAIPAVRLQSLRVTATPTILLVNHIGRVTKAWQGALSKTGESEVLHVLSASKHDLL